ncbi:M20 family metallopeptidase [Tropicimonas sp. IMCC34043]|uniref:M20 family metallopeptidase n=1 Tax=Tropicimonas sp. IMCC34043 TaxID=2248760 RepID=UPI000E26547A|nr:M20 family metallopeptidase [Tropicimonas sp. IMCC34043]
MTRTAGNLVDLTRKLVSFDTINPPGQETDCMEFAAARLEEAGFCCTRHRHSDTRFSIVATRGTGDGLPLCFSGHLDTVPLGNAPWRHDPFAGDIEGDHLFGRGSSDMKGGVAAFILACQAVPRVRGGVAVVLSVGEETGCDGARWLVEAGALPPAGAMIVAESTDNRPLLGHKGVCWLRFRVQGRTAHGATPELGENAILKALPLMTRLATFDPEASHPIMGRATANLGTIHGGINTNSVPDRCEMTLDLRSVAGITHDELRAGLERLAGPEVRIETLLDLPAVWSEPDDPWCARASAVVAEITGVTATPEVANYFTDAAVLKPAMGNIPVLILGPGSMDQPHSTDEFVLISRLIEAQSIYEALLADWTGAAD